MRKWDTENLINWKRWHREHTEEQDLKSKSPARALATTKPASSGHTAIVSPLFDAGPTELITVIVFSSSKKYVWNSSSVIYDQGLPYLPNLIYD